MKRFLCVLALALLCQSPALSSHADAAEPATAGVELTKINVVRIKTALKLTPAQQSYWPPIEAALHGLAREQTEPQGLMRRVSHRLISVALDGAAVARLAAAVRPLVRVLDDGQRQVALALAQEMGLGPMLAAL